jgi:hypothetical protein
MTTPWTTPTSFVNGIVMGATDFNTYFRDNFEHLKAPPVFNEPTAFGSPIVFTATTAIPITAGASASLQTYGGAVEIWFDGIFEGYQTVVTDYLIDIDGTGYTGVGNPLHLLITSLASGTHWFTPMCRTTGGAGGYSAECSAYHFWAREG